VPADRHQPRMTAGADALGALREALAAAGLRQRETIETHTAWVVLTDTHAYKVRKPVRFPFADLSTPERRRWASGEEVRLNQPLAGGLGYELRALARSPGGHRLTDADDPDAVEWVVVMRRFDERDTLAAHVEAGTVSDAAVDRVAAAIAAFHRDAEPLIRPRWDKQVRAVIATNLDQLADIVAADHPLRPRVEALHRVPEAVLPRHAERLRERGESGRVVEGHGDIRAEHVVLEGDRVLIIDRLEFDRAMRTVDVADDLAFLTTDLEALGARPVADLLAERYSAHGGDPGPPDLRALYGVHRAAVRAKVTLLRAEQVDARQAEADRARAADLLRLAEHLAWRARGPQALVVYGPPASGKSTLARALADRTGLESLSSDLVRKERLGLDPAERAPAAAYDPGARAAIYGELGRRARARLEAGEAVIVDATFGDAELRGAFLDALGAAGRDALRLVACRAPLEVLVRRAAERTAAAAAGSDAGPEVAERLARAWTPFDELPNAETVSVDTTAAPDEALEAALRGLDAAGSGSR